MRRLARADGVSSFPAFSLQVEHFHREPERHGAASGVYAGAEGAFDIRLSRWQGTGAHAHLVEFAGGADAFCGTLPCSVRHIPPRVVGQPAAAQASGDGVADHGGGAVFEVGASVVNELAPETGFVLMLRQRGEVFDMGGEEVTHIGLGMQAGEGFGEAQGGEGVAAAPMPR